MPKTVAKKLNDADLRKRTTPGVLADGDGLQFMVNKPGKDGSPGSKSWLLRLTWAGQRRAYGLGAYPNIGLALARALTQEAHRAVRMGIAPQTVLKPAPALPEAPSAPISISSGPRFAQVAKELHAIREQGFRNSKHAAQWISTLETYAFPTIGTLAVSVIDTPQVIDALAPIWVSKAETASRVRQRIEAVLAYGIAKGYRPRGLNPASIGEIKPGLPQQPSRANKHHEAMAHADLPAFFALIDSSKAGPAIRLALKLTVLTACRTGEVLGARWCEFSDLGDPEKAAWNIPADRMKAGVAHRVPLSVPAIAVLLAAKAAFPPTDPDDIVFQGRRDAAIRPRPLSNMAMAVTLRRLGTTATVHGFRSSFRDWTVDESDFPEHLAESALAHTVKGKVERAYRRTDLFDKRRALMGAWAKFCTTPAHTHLKLVAGGAA